MSQPADDSRTPLLLAASGAAAEGGDDSTQEGGGMKPVISECKLQDQCFLSTGATTGSEAYRKVQRKLVIACALCFVFMIVEVVGGYVAKSVAIMSDAAHMLSDVSAFLVSIFAAWAATQPSTWHYSFGYHRAEILGALVSVLTIWAVTGALVFEAVQRTLNPVRVDGKLMFIISVAGVCFNILIALTLGVHAHLGHSHGPGGCSGHDHSHSNGEHSHGHEHEHKREHSHTHGDAPACTGHNHSHAHSHSGGSSSSCSSHEGGGSSSSGAAQGGGGAWVAGAETQSAAAAPPAGGHGHACSGHHHHGGEQPAATAAAAAVPSPRSGAGVDETSIVINLPAGASAGGCGLSGHALACRCTISRRGSHEIEVRYELPSPATMVRTPPRSHGGGGKQQPAGGCGHSHGPSHEHGGAHGGAADINLRGAVLHVIGDLLQSVGVAVAGALIWAHQDDPRWFIVDPICTFVFSGVVLLTTKSILGDIFAVLMERTPHGLDVPAVSQIMSGMEGIRDVHDLHIWAISTSTSPVLTAHVHIGPDADANEVLHKLEQYVRAIGIDHSTIQICNPATQPQEEQGEEQQQ